MRRRDRIYEWTRRHPLAVDAAVAFALFVVPVVPVGLGYGWVSGLLGTAMCVALVFRRVQPVASFTAVAACGVVQWALAEPLTVANFLLLVSLYSVSAYGPRWASRVGLGVGMLGVVLAVTRYAATPVDPESFVITFVGLSATVIGAWALGDVRRVRQAYVAELLNRADQAERERDQRAQIAVAEERSRIAREMHDVVAHGLAVVVAQADGGRYAAEQDSEAAVKALDTIGDTGRGALADMRTLLGVLRTDAGSDDRTPQPGLALIPQLVESVRQTGMQVGLDIRGQPRGFGAGSSLTVYRAVQEALTNTLKHAGPQARAEVRLTYGQDGLTAEVNDDGRGAAAATDGDGHGLFGMRERIEAYGGEVSAGPASGGGWYVRLRIPYDDEE